MGLFLLNEKNDISVSIPLVNVEGINKQVMTKLGESIVPPLYLAMLSTVIFR
jgi:hypothetical protein